jgi:lambda family phage portal protein
MGADGNDGFAVAGSGADPIFNAAGQGRRLRMWRPSNAGPNYITLGQQGTILSRARDAARNDPWAGTALDKLVSNEIGTGIQAKTRNGTPERKKLVKAVWDAWTKVCDADGVFDFYGLQGLVDREWHEAGEIFVRLRNRRESDGLPVPLQLQLIEAEQCPAHYYAFASNGNVIRAGIEFNAIGQRVAYWMYPQHPGDVIVTNFADMQLRRIPAEQIIHVYEPIRAGQLRGLPHMTSTLVEMFNLGNLKDAVLMRQQIANLFSVFYTQAAGEAGLGSSPLAEAQNGTAPDGTPLAGLEPGTAQELPPGVKPEFSSPPDAGANFSPYMRTMLMAIAARAGIPYEVLTGDLANISDRALRLILNEFRRIVEQRQWLVLIPMLCQRVREAFWDSAVLAGKIEAPDYANKREEYVDTLWVPHGFPYSHPVQDVDADRKAVRSGFKSRSSVVLSNGDDPEEVETQIAEDNMHGDEHGFIFDSDPRYTSDRGITQQKPTGSVEPSTDNPASDNAPQEN